MQTTTATPLTPEHIALTTTLNLSEADDYYHILEEMIPDGDQDAMREIHALMIGSAMLYGLKALSYDEDKKAFVLVAAPIAVARAMLSMVRWEQKLLGGGA